MALAFPDTVELPHFEKISYRYKKKIFATLDEKKSWVCIKLDEREQDVFCMIDPTMIFPVPNKWGRQGWTIVNLTIVTPEILQDALRSSYRNVSKRNV